MSALKKVLIVDDNPRNLELLAVVLELDYEILEGSDGAVGFEVAKANQPDLILMDLSMPNVDGWEALKLLRAEPTTQAIPVVAVTAHALKGDEEKAIKAGFDGYITKPVDASALLDLMERLLAGA